MQKGRGSALYVNDSLWKVVRRNDKEIGTHALAVLEPLLLLKVGSGLLTTWVMVKTTPLDVVVAVVVIKGGAVLVVRPFSSVVVM